MSRVRIVDADRCEVDDDSLICLSDYSAMRGSRKFCQRGSKFDKAFFILKRGGRIHILQLAGSQRPASETPFKWRFAGGPMKAQH